MGGAAHAQPSQSTGDTAVVQTTPKVQATPRAEEYVALERTAATKVVAKDEVPKGSPLGVQLATIVVLVILGVGYFRLMSHSSRRAPATKPAEEPAVIPAAENGKQPDGA